MYNLSCTWGEGPPQMMQTSSYTPKKILALMHDYKGCHMLSKYFCRAPYWSQFFIDPLLSTWPPSLNGFINYLKKNKHLPTLKKCILHFLGSVDIEGVGDKGIF